MPGPGRQGMRLGRLGIEALLEHDVSCEDSVRGLA